MLYLLYHSLLLQASEKTKQTRCHWPSDATAIVEEMFANGLRGTGKEYATLMDETMQMLAGYPDIDQKALSVSMLILL
jgi:hypothetical protein